MVITATSEATVRPAVDELSSLGRIEGIPMNVADFEIVQKTLAGVIEKYGHVDILVNNAGITADAQIAKMTEEQFDKVMTVNVKGVFNCTRAVVNHMIERGYGRIINITSVTGHNGSFGQSNYAGSKGAVMTMTQTWAKELGKKGITVNAVAPGYTLTEMMNTVPEKVLDVIKEKTPLKRLGKPEEIAAACLYLASDEASFVNGAELNIDGGLIL